MKNNVYVGEYDYLLNEGNIPGIGWLRFWPFVPTNPLAWKILMKNFPKGIQDVGFVGHDDIHFYFQKRGSNTPIKVLMQQEALHELGAMEQKYGGTRADSVGESFDDIYIGKYLPLYEQIAVNETTNLTGAASIIKTKIDMLYTSFRHSVETFGNEVTDLLSRDTGQGWRYRILPKDRYEKPFSYTVVLETDGHVRNTNPNADNLHGQYYELTLDAKDGFVSWIEGHSSKWRRSKFSTPQEVVKAIKELIKMETE